MYLGSIAETIDKNEKIDNVIDMLELSEYYYAFGINAPIIWGRIIIGETKMEKMMLVSIT